MKDYKTFKENIPKLLDILKGCLINSSNYSTTNISYDFETFNTIESFYLDVVDGKEKVNISFDLLKDAYYAYVGETVINHIGGEWVICSVKNDDAFGTPIILNWGKEGSDHVRISPYVWEIILVRDREKGDIADIIKMIAKTDN